MKRTIRCEICGKRFKTDKPNHKYCSIRCRFEGMSRKREKWIGENPEYYRDYMARYSKKEQENIFTE